MLIEYVTLIAKQHIATGAVYIICMYDLYITSSVKEQINIIFTAHLNNQ